MLSEQSVELVVLSQQLSVLVVQIPLQSCFRVLVSVGSGMMNREGFKKVNKKKKEKEEEEGIKRKKKKKEREKKKKEG